MTFLLKYRIVIELLLVLGSALFTALCIGAVFSVFFRLHGLMDLLTRMDQRLENIERSLSRGPERED